MLNNEIKMFRSIRQYNKYLDTRKDIFTMNNTELSKLYGKKATDILKETNQENAVPVDLKKILQFFDISAVAMDFTEIEKSLSIENKILGALSCQNGKSAIFYNYKDKEDSHRYRFTIAHELAHVALQAETNHVEFRTDSTILTKEELAANTFAGELLIPQNSLYNIIDELLIPSVSVLADIFEVSINVMKERLKHLKIKTKIIGYNYTIEDVKYGK